MIWVPHPHISRAMYPDHARRSRRSRRPAGCSTGCARSGGEPGRLGSDDRPGVGGKQRRGVGVIDGVATDERRGPGGATAAGWGAGGGSGGKGGGRGGGGSRRGGAGPGAVVGGV